MTPRLQSHVLVGALLRRVQAAGGNAAILAKGDSSSGAILIVCAERGTQLSVRERSLGIDDRYVWRIALEQNPDKSADFSGYLARRRASDGDLWIVELDVPNAERFAAETTGDG